MLTDIASTCKWFKQYDCNMILLSIGSKIETLITNAILILRFCLS